jgi:hypothetical protein
MTPYSINQYQYYQYNYPDPTVGLYLVGPDNVSLWFNGVDYTFEVDRPETAGVFVYDVYNSLDVLIDTIQLTVAVVNPSIIHTLCLSDGLAPQSLPPPPIGSWVLSGNYYPDWLFLAFSGYAVATVPVVGEFYVLFETTINPLSNVYLVKFVFNSCLDEYDFCTPQDINIVWLNRAGGWSSYCFKGRKTYGVKIADKRTYKTADNLVNYFKIDGVFDSIQVLSGEIPVSHINFVKGLKYSIQAFIKWTGGFIPILIEDKDFDLYTDGDGLTTYDIKVQYSAEKLIQTQ